MKEKNKGVLLILLSSLFFALMSTFVLLSGDIPFFQKALFRNGVALLVSSSTLIGARRIPYVPKPCRLPLVSRVSCGVVSVFCNFYAIDKLILANSNSLNKLAPFFAIFLASIFLKERVERRQIVCIVIAFVGSMFIIVPSLSLASLSLPSLVALLGGVTSGGTQASLRGIQRAGSVHSSIVVFYFSLTTTVAALAPTLLLWTPMAPKQFFFLMMAGTCCAFGQYSLTNAYKYAAPRDISIYECVQIIFSGLLGFLIFDQVPSLYSSISYALIILASVLLSHPRIPDKTCHAS